MNGDLAARGAMLLWLAALAAVPVLASGGVVLREAPGAWAAIDNRKEIVAGSALDFSKMGFTDAPAGKHGWVKAVGDHFEFEALPGTTQRFYGENLCMSAAFPETAGEAERIAARLARLGYNAIRLHHHDQTWSEGEVERAKMDRLVAAAIRYGLYVTTDLYVSRRVRWRDIGIDRDGEMDMQTFKLYVALHDGAYANWQAFARDFLLRRNVETGRRYVDEPALFSLCLVNEGGFYLGWDTLGKRDEPVVREAWRRWLEGRRADDPGFYPAADPDLPPRNVRDRRESAVARLFFADMEGAFHRKASAWLKGELGVKALLTNDNCGVHPAPSARVADVFDYVDDHLYKDHPSFPEARWKLPARLPNDNPVLASHFAPCVAAFARLCDKPFTLSEWSYSGPARFRATGGLFIGAMAALQGWSGIWRFSYAQDRGEFDDPLVHPKFFELARDPLAQASDRLAALLFLRGDAAELPRWRGVALEATDEALTPPEGTPAWRASPPWDDLAWSLRVGTAPFHESANGWGFVLRRQNADAKGVEENLRRHAGTVAPQLLLDREAASAVFTSDRTEAVFATNGCICARALSANISGHSALVYASSLDGRPLESSARILVAHLTDVQGDGTTYSDATRTMLEAWGGRPLVAVGSATVALAVAHPEEMRVHALATDGARVGEVPAETDRDGRLSFVADTSSGTIHYELERTER